MQAITRTYVLYRTHVLVKPDLLDDDRHRAAVRAPRGAGHVRRARGAKERDHGRDLLGLGEPAERTSGRNLGQHLVAVAARLIG